MHELGHELGLGDRGKKETGMYIPSMGDGKGFWAVDYLSGEWKDLDLSSI